MAGWLQGIGVAILVYAAAVAAIIHARKWRRRATRTEGKIVTLGALEGTTHRSDRSWIVEFTDQSGQTRHFDINSSSMFDRYHVDMAVPVLYDPEDPDSGKVARLSHVYGLGLTLLVVGTLIALVSLANNPDVSSWLRTTLQL